MDFINVVNSASKLYQTVSVWCYEHQVDVLIFVGVIGICAWWMSFQREARRRLHRLIWGNLMKRTDRSRYQAMRFEDALVDAAMEMHFEGMMTEAEERAAFIEFAEKLGMSGLKPQKNVKQSIRTRLKRRLGLKPVTIPGGINVVKPDATYDPNKPDPEGLSASRYVRKKP